MQMTLVLNKVLHKGLLIIYHRVFNSFLKTKE